MNTFRNTYPIFRVLRFKTKSIFLNTSKGKILLIFKEQNVYQLSEKNRCDIKCKSVQASAVAEASLLGGLRHQRCWVGYNKLPILLHIQTI